MKKLLLPLMAIIAASCSPFPQDGTAKTVYVSVSLTYEDSQKAIPLPYTDNDARAFRDEMKLLAEASGMAFEAHEFIEEGSHLAEKRTKAIYGRDSLLLEFVQTATKNDAVIKLMKEEFRSIEVVRGGSVGIESISMMER